MSHTNLSQQQSGSYQQVSQEIQEEEDETEQVLTLTSKKPGSHGKRVKSMGKKIVEPEPQAETDPRVESDQKNDTFWYKIRDGYNDQAAKKGFTIRTKNMLTRKWTPMNQEVGKFNSLVNETKAMSGENDENLMTRNNSEPVINRADILDPALMRSGQFDCKIEFLYPTKEARARILQDVFTEVICDRRHPRTEVAQILQKPVTTTTGLKTLETSMRINFEGARRTALKHIEAFVRTFSDRQAFSAAALSSAPTALIQVSESAYIHEAGHLRCKFAPFISVNFLDGSVLGVLMEQD
uniref:Uncharacterized protein n=1 Tax=Tanacetum cinerariifolium TaxID=118510 RepID=A0A6L2NFG4_TANCI|nr:hypothetical protein [Tanacetum cinerariifolium]